MNESELDQVIWSSLNVGDPECRPFCEQNTRRTVCEFS